MKLKCEFSNQSYKPYACMVTSAAITEPRTLITGCTGVHANNRANDDVKWISFANTTVHYFPQGLRDIFPNLSWLTINDCGLKTISRDDLIGLGSLVNLDLNGNKLTSVPNDLLIGMNKLKSISFYGNQIEYLSSELLKPVMGNNWEWIDFRRNSKINVWYCTLFAGGIECVDELLKIIDKNCKKPINEDKPIIAYKSDQFAGMAALLKSGNFSDFTIITDSREFKAHKNILAVHSRLLAEKFKDEDLSEMRLEGVSSDSVDALLQYIYTEEMPQNVVATELLAISTKLQVRSLQLICEEIVLNKLTDSNASEIYFLGHALKCNNILKEAFARLRVMHPELREDLIDQPEKVKTFFAIKEQMESMRKQLSSL